MRARVGLAGEGSDEFLLHRIELRIDAGVAGAGEIAVADSSVRHSSTA